MSEENPQLEGRPSDAIRIDLAEVDRQIRDALPLDRQRLLELRKNRVYWEGENDGEVPSRQAEERLDYDQRPKQVSFMTRKVVRGLTRYTYCPGPSRALADAAATRWLEAVYTDNGINALWAEADREATLQGVAGFQVAATGDPSRPIRVHLWTADELAVWCPADDVLTPQAVCTITQDGLETVYTLYTRDFVQRYRTARAKYGMDRNLIRPDGDPVDNPHGRLPFAWVPFERPTRSFWVRGIGHLVRKVNARVDEKMSELAEAQRFYLKPIPLATGVPPGWRPRIQPGRFNIVPFKPGPNGQPVVKPEVWFLQAQVNIAEAWADVEKTIETGLSDLDIPLAAYRSSESATASGAAMVTEQLPLLKHAKARRLHYAGAECELARLATAIGGSYYDWSDAGLGAALLRESEDPQLTLAWPDDLRVPWMEAAQVQAQDLDEGLTSRVKIIMHERGFSRAQAERELAENVADEALYRQLQAAAGLPPDGSQDDPQPDGGDPPADPDGGPEEPGAVRPGDGPVPIDETPGPAASPGGP